MTVVNSAQVDAQLPLPTVDDQPGRLHGIEHLLITTLLQTKLWLTRSNQGEIPDSLEVKWRSGGYGHIWRET